MPSTFWTFTSNSRVFAGMNDLRTATPKSSARSFMQTSRARTAILRNYRTRTLWRSLRTMSSLLSTTLKSQTWWSYKTWRSNTHSSWHNSRCSLNIYASLPARSIAKSKVSNSASLCSASLVRAHLNNRSTRFRGFLLAFLCRDLGWLMLTNSASSARAAIICHCTKDLT